MAASKGQAVRRHSRRCCWRRAQGARCRLLRLLRGLACALRSTKISSK